MYRNYITLFNITMMQLLLSTLAMMGLTFLIGFFVAAVIKLIAYAADSFDFYSSHKLELLRLYRWRRHRQKVERYFKQLPYNEDDVLADTREDYSRGVNREISGYQQGYYHGVSHGAAQQNLMDYYYPADTHEFYLQEEERAHVNKKNSKKTTSDKK